MGRPADRHRRLGRCPDPNRVRHLQGLLPVARPRGGDRRPPGHGIPGREAPRRWRAGRPDLQAGADQRADRARGAGAPDGPRGARPRGVHGQSLPLQAAAQEGEPGGAVRRAERAALLRRPARRDSSAHIPWTRVVEERTHRSSDGKPIDLLPFIEQQRERLVLKPNDDYGGRRGGARLDRDSPTSGRRRSARPWQVPTSCRSGWRSPRSRFRAWSTARCTSSTGCWTPRPSC